MQNLTSDIAILLFTNTATQEAVEKNFVPGSGGGDANYLIAHTLLCYTLDMLQEVGLPLIVCTSEEQQGYTFGEKLSNAFHDVFEQGYQRVICVGSDCPTLQAKDLLNAAEQLLKHNMVVGPTKDGGAYLIGMHIDCFNPEAFSMLNWQTSEVLNELTIYSFRQQSCMGCFFKLDEKSDVDNSADLRRALQELPVLSDLKRDLLAILLEATNPYLHPSNSRFVLQEQSVRDMHLRAPPVY
ncbi:TIGR04282 family arsenosugar biosynthesis glycosyltransferase [Pontibacter harenae]|uniref:TIGR04282 family arsenosugar biosynthesis glycosyltransferase n=1 Tax=Pontibacter harenae TaxID=2894083 RepID=UPI001E33393F|nr:DUF2064 domain-containing protein [Pontibacter harenae]MCC9166820.1 DUF2064 domain-containing protein [Pontibacter harenae]